MRWLEGKGWNLVMGDWWMVIGDWIVDFFEPNILTINN